MAATKEQERKALARIKKIVEELGEDSYIGMAFDGCFDVAEENIENDFACSMRQRAEHAEMEAGKYKKMYEDTAADFEAAEATIAGLEQKVLSTARGRSNQSNPLSLPDRGRKTGRRICSENCRACRQPGHPGV